MSNMSTVSCESSNCFLDATTTYTDYSSKCSSSRESLNVWTNPSRSLQTSFEADSAHSVPMLVMRKALKPPGVMKLKGPYFPFHSRYKNLPSAKYEGK